MGAQASSLTDQQIEDVAAYLASLGGDTVAAAGGTAPSIEANSDLHCLSRAERHQPVADLADTGWPARRLPRARAEPVSGWHAHRLRSCRPWHRWLTDADVEILARYYSRLDGLETTEAD